MVVQYKCQNCGADMAYNTASGKLHCDSCGHDMNIEDLPIPIFAENEKEHIEEAPHVEPFRTEDIKEEQSFDYEDQKAVEHSNFEEGTTSSYHCNNCGADIITDTDTTATTCSFCGAGVVLADRLQGELQPTYIIPFKINKQEAQEAFKKWCRGGRLLPKDFMTADRISNITGLYVPFWLYDLNGKGDIDATGTKVRTYTRGDYIYTETSYYHIYRRVNLNYQRVPVDASTKMDDTLMNLIEPYNYTDLKDFNLPYLSSYIAEKYNDTCEDAYPRVKEKCNHFVEDYIRTTINGYTTVTTNRKNIDIHQLNGYYTLLPVWMVCYDYKDAKHNFFLNGQTGKIVGKPPLSKKRILAWFSRISVISLVIIKIIVLIFGGGLI